MSKFHCIYGKGQHRKISRENTCKCGAKMINLGGNWFCINFIQEQLKEQLKDTKLKIVNYKY